MDFSELFTQGARDILPLARKKNLACCFDCSGSFIDVEQGHDQLRSATHRILLGMVDCLDSGFILLRATADPAQNGSSLVVIHAAGTGVCAPAGIDGVLRRLQLHSRAGTNGERGDGITSCCGRAVQRRSADTPIRRWPFPCAPAGQLTAGCEVETNCLRLPTDPGTRGARS